MKGVISKMGQILFNFVGSVCGGSDDDLNSLLTEITPRQIPDERQPLFFPSNGVRKKFDDYPDLHPRINIIPYPPTQVEHPVFDSAEEVLYKPTPLPPRVCSPLIPSKEPKPFSPSSSESCSGLLAKPIIWTNSCKESTQPEAIDWEKKKSQSKKWVKRNAASGATQIQHRVFDSAEEILYKPTPLPPRVYSPPIPRKETKPFSPSSSESLSGLLAKPTIWTNTCKESTQPESIDREKKKPQSKKWVKRNAARGATQIKHPVFHSAEEILYKLSPLPPRVCSPPIPIKELEPFSPSSSESGSGLLAKPTIWTNSCQESTQAEAIDREKEKSQSKKWVKRNAGRGATQIEHPVFHSAEEILYKPTPLPPRVCSPPISSKEPKPFSLSSSESGSGLLANPTIWTNWCKENTQPEAIDPEKKKFQSKKWVKRNAVRGATQIEHPVFCSDEEILYKPTPLPPRVCSPPIPSKEPEPLSPSSSESGSGLLAKPTIWTNSCKESTQPEAIDREKKKSQSKKWVKQNDARVLEDEKKLSIVVFLPKEKRIKHYSNQHRILLVGEGDFSFSACLARSFRYAPNITATSLNLLEFLLTNYGCVGENIGILRTRGSIVIHGVDATKIASNRCFRNKKFDRIVFNFPHAGFKCKEEKGFEIRRHQNLVLQFLRSAKELVDEEGEIHVSHKSNKFHGKWSIEKLGSDAGLRLVSKIKFKLGDYPGYNTKYGFGGDKNFDCNPSLTYKFGLQFKE